MTGWDIFFSFCFGCFGMFTYRFLERLLQRRHPPRDTAELMNRIASVAHPLIEARLTCAWHEAELAQIIDNLPPVFEDQVMLAAQLGQAIEQSVMREVQRRGLPNVRLSGDRSAGYAGWISKWLRPQGVEPVEKPIITISEDPQLPERGVASVPPPPPRASSTMVPPPFASVTLAPPSSTPSSTSSAASSGPALIFRNGSWVPRKSVS